MMKKTEAGSMHSASHKVIRKPRKYEVVILRFLILGGFFSMFQFLWWYFDSDFIGHRVLYWLLLVSLGYKMLHLGYEWYYLGAIGKTPQWQPPENTWKADMLTTFVPGEPYAVVEKTLRAMVKVRYPHTTYLCDEGDDPYLKKLCTEIGAVHVYRGKDKTGAKAGNINYTLRNFATGDICVILDPDHEPVPEFLDRTLPYFDDPRVGYVQCIQGYSNAGESLVAKGAAEQTYLFYGPMMMGMHRQGTVQAIGANCTFRRAALNSIGGHAIGLCEDMHTSMQLHAQKWTSVYVPELLTRGLTPSSLSAFYKQQLKWSRGSFELLFEVYPKLFGRFNWRQRLHYLLTPLYFLSGLIVLIDLVVPVASLVSSQVPLFISFTAFLLHGIPLFLSATVIRHYAQHFLLDQHEKGFHVMGSILRMGTWWIYLLGMVYAVFRIKVPYIPTPKESDLTNEWKICIPNLIVIALNITAVVYGLYRDWTPFSWLMAGFAGINAVLLGLAVLMGQQYWIAQLFRSRFSILRAYWFNFRHRLLYRFIQHDGVVILCTFFAFGISAMHMVRSGLPVTLASVDEIPDTKRMPWVLTANDFSGHSATSSIDNWQHKKLAAFRLEAETPDSALQKVAKILLICHRTDQLPLILWNIRSPATKGLLSKGTGKSLSRPLAELLRDYQLPVIISQCHVEYDTVQPGNPASLESPQMMKEMLDSIGASNVSWAGVLPADSLQNGYHKRFTSFDLILVQLKNTDNQYIDSLSARIHANRPVLFFTENLREKQFFDRLVAQLRRAEKPVLGWFDKSQLLEIPADSKIDDAAGTGWKFAKQEKNIPQQKYSRGIRFDSVTCQYQWMVNGSPFYVKGVVYNPEHDWRDGRWPPTRRQLETDFSRIKSMGGNTIIREGHSVYDRNILNLAAEYDLKVLFGFWCDPSIDYAAETEKAGHLKKEILALVNDHRNHPALLAWVVSNGTWNGLGNHFHQPYLTQTRLAYVEWLEHLVSEIKNVDDQRLVIKSIYGDREFSGALDDLRLVAPSIDIIAFNASTLEQLETFDQTMRSWKGGQPYLVSGFGGKALWDTLVSGVGRNEILPDKSSFEKARSYAQLWTHGIEKKRGANLGGAAYCWRDRMEGTATMSGITDYKGRLKPAYFTLKQLWTGESQAFPLADLWLKCDVFFENNKNYFIFSALTPNNTMPDLDYEWYICREEYLEHLEEVTINYQQLGHRRFYFLSNYYEHIRGKFSPQANGTKIKFLTKRADALQRVYLHISDKQGHVVTASFPIHPERLIQRTK